MSCIQIYINKVNLYDGYDDDDDTVVYKNLS